MPTARTVLKAIGVGLATGSTLAGMVLLTLIWPGLRVIWPLAFVAVIPTGALATRWAGPARGAGTVGLGLLAGAAAGGLSAEALLLASRQEPAWDLVGVLGAPPFGLGPFDWFGSLPWTLPLLPPLGAILAALEAWLCDLLFTPPASDIRVALANWIARRPLTLQSKLLVAFLVLVGGTFLGGWLGFAAMESTHQRLHGLELQTEWSGHLRSIQTVVRQERAILDVPDAGSWPARLGHLRQLDAQVRAEIDHLASYPPHPDLPVSDAQRRQEAEALRPLLDTASAPYLAFSARLQQATADRPVEVPGLAAILAAADGASEVALQQLIGRQGTSLFELLTRLDADQHSIEIGFVLVALTLTSLGALLATAFARAIVGPVQAIMGQLDCMGRGDFSRRLAVGNADELGRLARAVNRVNGELDGLYRQLGKYAADLERKVADQVAEIGRVRGLERYLPRQVVEQVLRGELAFPAQHERRKVTVLFADMEGFTSLSDRVEAEELGSLLNEYFAVMSEAVFRHGGTLLSFIGDAVMVVFGAPAAPQPVEDAQGAVELGLDMQRAVREWGQSWRQRGLDRPPAIRVGIHSGYVTIGTFGTQTRSEYSAMGRTTNLAARVQSAAPSGGVLVTWATRALAGEGFVYADRGLLQAKGLHTPVEIFEVRAQSTEVRGASTGCTSKSASLLVLHHGDHDGTRAS
jgi:class 3 adenylate cyclase